MGIIADSGITICVLKAKIFDNAGIKFIGSIV